MKFHATWPAPPNLDRPIWTKAVTRPSKTVQSDGGCFSRTSGQTSASARSNRSVDRRTAFSLRAARSMCGPIKVIASTPSPCVIACATSCVATYARCKSAPELQHSIGQAIQIIQWTDCLRQFLAQAIADFLWVCVIWQENR